MLHDEARDAGRLLLAVLGQDLEVLLVRVVDEVDPAPRVVVGAGLAAVLVEVALPRAEEQRDAVVDGGQHEAVRAGLQADRAVAAAAAAEEDVALAGRRVDALLDGRAQPVRVVVQRALEELDLVAGVHALDLVAQDLAADDLGLGVHEIMVTGPRWSCRRPRRVGGRVLVRAACGSMGIAFPEARSAATRAAHERPARA